MQSLQIGSYQLSLPSMSPPPNISQSIQSLQRGQAATLNLGNVILAYASNQIILSTPGYIQQIPVSSLPSLISWLSSLSPQVQASRLTGLPRDLRRELLLRFDYNQLLKTCPLEDFKTICGDESFWREKARELGVSDDVWKAGFRLTPQERYLRSLAYRTEGYYPGLEKYLPATEIIRRAGKEGREDVVRSLLTRKNESYTAALLGAIQGRHTQLALQLMSERLNIMSEQIFYQIGLTNNTRVLEALKTRIGPILYPNIGHGAARGGHRELLFSLEANIADLFNTGAFVSDALTGGHVELARELIQRQRGVNLLTVFERYASDAGRSGNMGTVDFVSNLIPDQPHSMIIGYNGGIPLTYNTTTRNTILEIAFTSAARNGHLALIREIIARGVDLHKSTWDDALLLAPYSDNIELVDLLLKSHSHSQEILLEMLSRAVSGSKPEMVVYLLPLVANPNLNELLTKASTYADTPNLEVVDLLLYKGATNLNAVLVQATKRLQLPLIKYLVSLGATNIREAARNIADWGTSREEVRAYFTDLLAQRRG